MDLTAGVARLPHCGGTDPAAQRLERGMPIVASYNIRKSVGLDRQRRPDRILDVLGELQADVVALQEADRRFGARQTTIPFHLLADQGR